MNARNRRHAGFTLVEMLVVVAIIGILASMVGGAAYIALNYAKNARIKTELDQLDMAIKAFKEKYNVYPPCNLTNIANNTALQAFVMSNFPRYSLRYPSGTPTLVGTIQQDLQNAGIDTTNFRPDAALVFWLQGFNADVTQPFTNVPTSNAANYSGGTSPGFSPLNNTNVTPFFGFDQTRLALTKVGNTYCFVYTPLNQTSPYVYFDTNEYGSLTNNGAVTNPTSGSGPYTTTSGAPNPSQYTNVPNTDGSSAGTATPYVFDVNGNGALNVPPDTFCNPTTFQIISAGQDNQFGAFPNNSTWRLFPSGTGYDTSGNELDNITNFNDRPTLADKMP